MLPPMRRLGGLCAVIVIGCQGETVQTAQSDTGSVTETAAADTSAPSDTSAITDTSTDSSTTDSVVSGDCGTYRGTKMVKVHAKYCIDEHEVTNGQWKQFAAAPETERTAATPEHCSWNTTPPTVVADPATDDYPRGKVNFCDAKTYCAWAGKRLCGNIDGGMNYLSDFNNAAKSQWHNACSGGGARIYPYGDTYDEAKCATGSSTPVKPKTFTNCHGAAAPFDAVFDLSGNVDEWEDSCASAFVTASTLCRGRGGATGDHAEAKCDRTAQSEARSRFDGLGFRCCKDL